MRRRRSSRRSSHSSREWDKSMSAVARCRRCEWSFSRSRSTSTASGWKPCARCWPRPTPTGRRARWRTLTLSVILVVLVVFLFLRNARATLIPSVAVPVSLVTTFGVMYLAGYSLNNLSLMALTIATGFVVDDAIVVLENTSRHIEAGMPPFQAALKGAREVSFTVVSMSFSLIAVFIPILFMGGLVGRVFREFAVTLSVAILVSF